MIVFVGAGSGAADLITVRGAELLKKADIIIYAGSLVNPALLNYRKESCQVYNSAEMNLEEIITVMSEAEKHHKLLIRLHTGDPSLYGAIREQMEELAFRHIGYEVVPGVSSFCGAAAAIKTEYTQPEGSQTVILTRMAGRTPVPERESIRSLAAHGSAMVIFLSAGLLQDLQKELLAGGYKADTKAAIVYKATWPDEKVLHCTISSLAETAEINQIRKTALILVGDFLEAGGSRSKLYDKYFTTEFRQGESQ